MEYIDCILYINLENRQDRKEHVLHELRKICQDENKIQRIDAIKDDIGAFGCGLSHCKALTTVLSHPEWKRVLIIEDDFTFKSSQCEEINSAIKTLIEYDPHMDVGLLSYGHHMRQTQDTTNPVVKKVIYSQTTSSYIITQEYAQILLNNMTEALNDMKERGKRHENCIDIHWTILQPKGRWYLVTPAIGYQYENYSDIEKCYVNYGC